MVLIGRFYPDRAGEKSPQLVGSGGPQTGSEGLERRLYLSEAVVQTKLRRRAWHDTFESFTIIRGSGV